MDYGFFAISLRRLLSGIVLLSFASNVLASPQQTEEECVSQQRYTFSWNTLDSCSLEPRGGTSKGANTTLDVQPHDGWQALQDPELSDFERDRQAILAMAGPYRVSFDFIETMGFTAQYSPSKPYQSWGTEYVYVAEDSGDFISLQHIMVMVFQRPSGELSEPMVMKHWRQDWKFEQQELFEYAGHNVWKKRTYSSDKIQGNWTQSVYQVDDSPRYQAFGQWRHEVNYSQWTSSNTWRPLPRREGSVRDDYHVLEGTNSHIILPTGWVQEEHNNKLVLNESGDIHPSQPYLAREVGIARYERIVDHDFTPGDEYWLQTKHYWQDVKAVWRKLIHENSTIQINKSVDGQWMFMPFFQRASELDANQDYNAEKQREWITEQLQPFVTVCAELSETTKC